MLCRSSFPCHGACDDVKTIIVIVAHRARRGQGPWKHLTSYNQRERIMWYIYQRKSHWSNKVIQGVWYLCSGLAALWDRFYIYISLTSGLLLLRCFHFAVKVSFCGRIQEKKKDCIAVVSICQPKGQIWPMRQLQQASHGLLDLVFFSFLILILKVI